MKLIEGNSATSVRKYTYKGFTVIQRRRPYDGRNKSHNGYEWEIVGRSTWPTRAEVKSIIDKLTQ